MNKLTHYLVPDWISAAFLLAIPLPFILIVIFIYRHTRNTQYKRAALAVAAFFILYLAYIGVAGYNNWFNQVSLPPRVLLFTTFPLAFLLFAVAANTKVYASILKNAPLESLVAVHIFRVIGVFFILLALHHALPKPFAFIAGAGDMITAGSCIFVAAAVKNKKQYAKKLTYWWNIFGTLDILFTAIAANILTKLSIDTGAMGVDSLAFLPFCIIPAFAPPVILFLHWSVFKKLNQITV